jgi:hypothetical protein
VNSTPIGAQSLEFLTGLDFHGRPEILIAVVVWSLLGRSTSHMKRLMSIDQEKEVVDPTWRWGRDQAADVAVD